MLSLKTRMSCERPINDEMMVLQIRMGLYGIDDRYLPKNTTPASEKTAPTTLMVPMNVDEKCSTSV